MTLSISLNRVHPN